MSAPGPSWCKWAHPGRHTADNRRASQETDRIMDVYTLTTHYVPSCRSWRTLPQLLLPDPVSLPDHYTWMGEGCAEITDLSQGVVYSPEPAGLCTVAVTIERVKLLVFFSSRSNLRRSMWILVFVTPVITMSSPPD